MQINVPHGFIQMNWYNQAPIFWSFGFIMKLPSKGSHLHRIQILYYRSALFLLPPLPPSSFAQLCLSYYCPTHNRSLELSKWQGEPEHVGESRWQLKLGRDMAAGVRREFDVDPAEGNPRNSRDKGRAWYLWCLVFRGHNDRWWSVIQAGGKSGWNFYHLPIEILH